MISKGLNEALIIKDYKSYLWPYPNDPVLASFQGFLELLFALEIQWVALV